MQMHRLHPKTSFEEARSLLLTGVHPIPRTEMVPLADSLGRVAARTVRTRSEVPAFPSSHVDGYAVRAKDLTRASLTNPVSLRLVGEIHAGEIHPRKLGTGETVAIATGAAIPLGADGVEMFEEVSATPREITFRTPVPRDQGIDPAGGDLPRGSLLAKAGQVVTPAAIGLLARGGQDPVQVYARPRVAILANGNELIPPGLGPLPAGKVFESNSAPLAALIRAAGGHPIVLPPLRDEARAIEAGIRAALRSADLVVTSGGTSVGERDLLHRVLPRFGSILFNGVRVRPGMPTIVCRAGRKSIVGMPGHPASCLTNALWLVVPAVRKLAHLPGDGTEEVRVRIRHATRLHGQGFSTVVPLRIRGDWADSTFHGSHFITSLQGANGYAVLPPTKERLRKGEHIYAKRATFLEGAIHAG